MKKFGRGKAQYLDEKAKRKYCSKCGRRITSTVSRSKGICAFCDSSGWRWRVHR